MNDFSTKFHSDWIAYSNLYSRKRVQYFLHYNVLPLGRQNNSCFPDQSLNTRFKIIEHYYLKHPKTGNYTNHKLTKTTLHGTPAAATRRNCIVIDSYLKLNIFLF